MCLCSATIQISGVDSTSTLCLISLPTTKTLPPPALILPSSAIASASTLCIMSVSQERRKRECVCVCAVRQPQHVNTLRHFATFGSSSSRCGLLHRNATSDSLSSSGKQAPKQTNQKSKTPRSHTGSTTHVIRDPKPDPFGASSSSSQAHLLQTLLAPTCDLVVPLPLC